MLESRPIAVVVPAFNEARWIAETIRTVPGFVDHLIVVDDRSSDGTGAIARAAGGGRAHVLCHDRNRGVGAAIVTGYRCARRLGADVVAVMAGDGQMHPDDLESVVLPVARGESDYVKGDRLAHPDVWRHMPIARLTGTRLLAWITRKAAGLSRLSDSQCGFTAISGGAIDALDLDALWQRYGYCNQLIAEVARAGLRLGEVTVRPVYRGEASGLRPWHVFTYALVLGRIAAARLTSSRETRRSPSGAPARPTPLQRSPARGPALHPVEPDAPRAARA